MNILNRRMFAIGGQADNESITFSDGRTQEVSLVDFQNQVNGLGGNELFALKKSADGGQIVFSPGLKNILDTAAGRKSAPVLTAASMGSDTGFSRAKDYGRTALGMFGPVVSGAARGLLSEENIEGRPFLKKITEYDSPFYGEGSSGFRRALDRGGRTTEQLESLVRTPPVADFEQEITAINNPTIEDQGPVEPVVAEPSILDQSISSTPNVSVTGESLEFTGDLIELDKRKRAYEASLIGVDEFGDPIQRPEPIDNEIANLIQEMTPAELTVNTDLTEEESANNTDLKFDGLSPDELKKEIDKSATPTFDLPAPSMNKVDTTVTESITGSRDNSINRKLQEPGFFGSDRFLDFIRNVGGELVRTGQMGEGLASGAAKAAEERAARDLMAEQENRELKQKMNLIRYEAGLKGGETLSGADLTKYVQLEDEVATALKNFDEDQRILSDVNTVINEDLNDPKAFGVGGWMAKISNDLAAAAGMGAEEWEDLSSAKRTEIILEVTAQRSVRNILGESGKTISNLDRDIVAKIFGSVNIFTSKAEIQKKLENSRSNIIEGMRANQNSVIIRASGLRKVGYDSDMIRLNASLIDLIMDFNFDDALRYNFKEGTSAGYQEISI